MTGRRYYDMQMIKFRRIQINQAPVATPTMCLNEETVQPVSQAQIEFEHFCLVKSGCDASRIRSRNTYLHVSDFDKGRIIAYRDCKYFCSCRSRSSDC
ncbi:hypothetical protein TNCV_1526911 [Trichonephila clavipes]|nr:hypothetical protein TNCV_1526911 [Trichonephila clavipes]